MKLFARTHAIQHSIQHAVHEALNHTFHHARHHGHHGVIHHGRPTIVHHAAEDGSSFEDLERRMMMSGTPLHAEPVLFSAVATAKTVQTVTTTSKTTTTTTTTITTGPVPIADPTPTDNSFKYASFASDPLFGPSGPSVNDISQGELGDCYLLSVLSSVAKTDAALIKQVITANTNGTFTVTFTGKKTVTVDADLATLSDGRPAYAQLGSGNSLWVSLIEKAYADYANPKADTYTTINGGWMGDAFSALGLKSSSTFSASSPTAFASLVQKDLKAKDFVTMGTASYVGVNSPLVAGHAYEIDSVVLNTKGVVTSITLRNPWGNDIAGGGYLTVTPQQAFNAFAGLSISHA